MGDYVHHTTTINPVTVEDTVANIFLRVAPVQNTWYTAFEFTSPKRILELMVRVADTQETLGVRITTSLMPAFFGSQVAVADQYYSATIGTTVAGNAVFFSAAGVDAVLINGVASGIYQTFKVEVRKTTAAGVGNINAIIHYANLS